MSDPDRSPQAVSIRPAQPDDAEQIAVLAGQLGYPATAEQMRCRLAAAARDLQQAVFVAEDDAALVGWVHVVRRDLLVSDGDAELAGLIVDEGRRGQGLGRRLVAHAEQWARQQGCLALRVRSNVVRDDAHAFYRRLGFVITKRQSVFRRGF